jgi:glycosyltransferase involved in cell wall biosynthesis
VTAPLFSVLLPTHASPATLPVAIRSVLQQQEPDFELLVVGDGASADTAAVVHTFDDPRIRWFDFPKAPGPGYANRNRALREARGSLIAYAQDDDIWLPDHLSRLGRIFQDAPRVSWAYSIPLWVAEDGIVIPTFINLKVPRHRHEFLHVRNFIPSTAVGHRRECFDRLGYWRETAEGAADWDMWKRIILADGAGRILALRLPTVLHFKSASRIDGRWLPAGRLRSLDLLSRISDAWPRFLRLDVSGDSTTPVQVRIEALMAAEPALMQRLRAGTEELSDLLAWSGLEKGFL